MRIIAIPGLITSLVLALTLPASAETEIAVAGQFTADFMNSLFDRARTPRMTDEARQQVCDAYFNQQAVATYLHSSRSLLTSDTEVSSRELQSAVFELNSELVNTAGKVLQTMKKYKNLSWMVGIKKSQVEKWIHGRIPVHVVMIPDLSDETYYTFRLTILPSVVYDSRVPKDKREDAIIFALVQRQGAGVLSITDIYDDLPVATDIKNSYLLRALLK